MQIRRRTFNGTSNRLTKRANGSSKKVPHYARIKSNPTGGSKRRKIALRRRSRRYSSSGGAGPAGAGGLKAEIAAIDAAFNGAVGANMTKDKVKEALLAHKKAAHPALSDKAKSHMLTLIQSLSQYANGAVITPALLAADRVAIQAARDAAVSKDIASRSCARPDPLSTPLDHSGTDPKSKPASPRKH
jgi:hypothetical protein